VGDACLFGGAPTAVWNVTALTVTLNTYLNIAVYVADRNAQRALC